MKLLLGSSIIQVILVTALTDSMTQLSNPALLVNTHAKDAVTTVHVCNVMLTILDNTTVEQVSASA